MLESYKNNTKTLDFQLERSRPSSELLLDASKSSFVTTAKYCYFDFVTIGQVTNFLGRMHDIRISVE